MGGLTTYNLSASESISKVPRPIDSSLAGHILAGYALGGTGLEGNQTKKTAGYVERFLEDVISNKGKGRALTMRKPESLAKHKHAMGRLKEHSIALEGPVTWSGIKKKFEEDSPKIISDLKEHGEAWINGGYKEAKGGHAMAYRLFKQGDDSYGFSIYNTGDGSQFHDGSFQGLKEKRDPALTYVDIPKSQVIKDGLVNEDA
ncbi:hypothetical protein SCG7086_CE_00100, partial [Chlamydiales bacterium SCGC AG-110-P3]